MEAVDWVIPGHRCTRWSTSVRGPGALTRLLVGKADEVMAVEPDDRMRACARRGGPGHAALAGRGESLPLPDGSVDAVLASSSWHWMDPIPTLDEIARVLVPGGTLAAMWSGPDPDAGLIAQAAALLGGDGEAGGDTATAGPPDDSAPSAASDMGIDDESRSELAEAIKDRNALPQELVIPEGVPFDQPEQTPSRGTSP